jgi:hypothetical protein
MIEAAMPNIFSFEGEAARKSSEGCYWVAMAKGIYALLLAGSPANAIGAGTPQVDFEPSIDPVNAIQYLLKGFPVVAPEFRLACAWQTIMKGPFSTQRLTKPRVEGMAIFAEMFAMDKVDGWPNVERLVVGSPIYVRQVASEPHTG